MSNPSRAQQQFLLRAYQSGKSEFDATATARWFSENTGIGTFDNRKWRWQETDRVLVRQYLIASMKIEDPDIASSNFAKLSRIEAAHWVVDEKHASQRPRHGRVLLRSAQGAVRLNGAVSSNLTRSTCHDLHVDEIMSIEHDCLVFVENFEALIGFEKVLIKDFPYQDPLLVYRGDAINPTNGSKTLAEKASCPVVAFTDLDPQGMNIASSLPNVSGAILPIEVGTVGNDDLYLAQQHLLGTIEKYPSSWRPAITAMSMSGKCQSQEFMIARGVVCGLFR